jgi:hypothetical protein
MLDEIHPRERKLSQLLVNTSIFWPSLISFPISCCAKIVYKYKERYVSIRVLIYKDKGFQTRTAIQTTQLCKGLDPNQQ